MKKLAAVLAGVVLACASQCATQENLFARGLDVRVVHTRLRTCARTYRTVEGTARYTARVSSAVVRTR